MPPVLGIVLVLATADSLLEGAYLERWFQGVVLAGVALLVAATGLSRLRSDRISWALLVVFACGWADFARFSLAEWASRSMWGAVALASFVLLYGFAFRVPRRISNALAIVVGSAFAVLAAAWLFSRFITSPSVAHAVGRVALLLMAARVLPPAGAGPWGRHVPRVSFALAEGTSGIHPAMPLVLDALGGWMAFRASPRALKGRTAAAAVLLVILGAVAGWAAVFGLIEATRFLLRVGLLGISSRGALRGGGGAPARARSRGARAARPLPG